MGSDDALMLSTQIFDTWFHKIPRFQKLWQLLPVTIGLGGAFRHVVDAATVQIPHMCRKIAKYALSIEQARTLGAARSRT